MTKVFHYAASVALGALVATGCADAYRASADADVYRLLHDRKEKALGYDPQAVSDPVVQPGVSPAPLARPAEEADRAERDTATGKDPRSLAQENDPAAPPSRRAYARLPMTPIPPMEPPPLHLPTPVNPGIPLGPYKDELPHASGSFGTMDPFAADMA